jgi:hypothetical protein
MPPVHAAVSAAIQPTGGRSGGIRKLRAGQDASHLKGALARLDDRLPTVGPMRPGQPWSDVVQVLNRGQAATWTVERLRRTVRRLVDEGIVETRLLDHGYQGFL